MNLERHGKIPFFYSSNFPMLVLLYILPYAPPPHRPLWLKTLIGIPKMFKVHNCTQLGIETGTIYTRNMSNAAECRYSFLYHKHVTVLKVDNENNYTALYSSSSLYDTPTLCRTTLRRTTLTGTALTQTMRHNLKRHI